VTTMAERRDTMRSLLPAAVWPASVGIPSRSEPAEPASAIPLAAGAAAHQRGSRPGRFLRRTRVQSALVAGTVFATALIASGTAIVLSWPVINGRQSDTALIDQSTVIKTDFLQHDRHLASRDIPLESANGVPVDVAILDPDDVVLARTPLQPIQGSLLLSFAAEARAGMARSADVTDGSGIARSVHATRLDTAGDVLVVSRSLTEDQDDLLTTIPILVAITILTVTVGVVLSYWLAGRVLRPVHQIAGMARTISDGDLHQRVDAKAPDDELGELATTFNAMLARLESAFEAQRMFTADASHELRSPIAVMRLELDRGLNRPRSAREYRDVLRWLRDDVDHLGRIVDQLLILTRADAGMLRPALRPVDVADLLREAASRWARVAREKRVTIELELSVSGSTPADAALLDRVVDNLLDNAIRHAPPGSGVRLRANRTAAGLNVDVLDHGPGVTPEFRPYLFSRFGRADSAHSAGGAGLGLALGAAIARAHCGSLDLVDGSGPGAVFRLHLPNLPATA